MNDLTLPVTCFMHDQMTINKLLMIPLFGIRNHWINQSHCFTNAQYL